MLFYLHKWKLCYIFEVTKETKTIFFKYYKIIIMTNQENYLTTLHFVSFEYFTHCVKNGATPTQAKKEMLTKIAQKAISKKVNELLKA